MNPAAIVAELERERDRLTLAIAALRPLVGTVATPPPRSDAAEGQGLEAPPALPEVRAAHSDRPLQPLRGADRRTRRAGS